MKKDFDKMLTDVELELMSILWRIEEGSVADVMKELSPERDLAYTSVSTIMRILEQKKIIKARKEGRGHIYIPILLREDYEKKAVKHVVDKVFEGTPSLLIKQLLDSDNLSEKDLSEIKILIKKMEKNK